MRKFRGLLILILAFALSISLAACSTNTASKVDNNSTSKTTANVAASKTAFPIKITDFLGREVTINKEPNRIVSLAPSTTELIYALGLGNKVVGVTDFDDYPPEVKNVAKVGGFKGPNIEAIAANKPDIIFASSLSGKDQMDALQKMGIPVVMLEAKDINQIYSSIKLIGKMTGTEKKGEELISSMQNKIKEINDKVKDLPKVNAYYLVSIDGNWTAGKGTFLDELITLAGGKNVADDVNGWAQYSIEQLVKKNPDAIITSQHAGDVKNLKNMAGFKDTNAAKNGKIFIISNDDIVNRASDRIVLGLEEIAKDLHPEAFK